MGEQPHDFDSAKSRLEEIANTVSDESLSLDEALDLFEEAVSIGLAVSDYVEEGIVVEELAGEQSEGQSEQPEGQAVQGDAAPQAPAPQAPASESE